MPSHDPFSRQLHSFGRHACFVPPVIRASLHRKTTLPSIVTGYPIVVACWQYIPLVAFLDLKPIIRLLFVISFPSMIVIFLSAVVITTFPSIVIIISSSMVIIITSLTIIIVPSSSVIVSYSHHYPFFFNHHHHLHIDNRHQIVIFIFHGNQTCLSLWSLRNNVSGCSSQAFGRIVFKSLSEQDQLLLILLAIYMCSLLSELVVDRQLTGDGDFILHDE